MVVAALLVMGLAGAPVLAQASGNGFSMPASEPQLDLTRKFALPRADYRAPDGTWKHGDGIIVGRDISPNTTVGLGFFRMKPRSQEGMSSPPTRKSHKVSVGFSTRF